MPSHLSSKAHPAPGGGAVAKVAFIGCSPSGAGVRFPSNGTHGTVSTVSPDIVSG